jgi:23S rRNA pseudouridine1911/1915/1917 synthase
MPKNPDPASETAPESARVTVAEEQSGERLDRVLAAALGSGAGDLSRSRIKALIEAGQAQLANGATIDDPAFRVKPGQVFTLAVPAATAAEPEAQKMDLDIVYEDKDLIVIDKPAGLVVHPAPGSPDNTLVNALIAHCGASLSGIGGVKRPGIVHRIDKDTSGLIVAAKNDATHHALSTAFTKHDIERAYSCVTWGCPIQKSGIIEGNIGRSPKDRKKMAVVKHGGKHAVTHYQVQEFFGAAMEPGAALIECRLETGRTHQIRVHLSAIGNPLIGDPVYAKSTPARRNKLSPTAREAADRFPRQALHAGILGFTHPRTGKELRWESELPADMTALIARLRA